MNLIVLLAESKKYMWDMKKIIMIVLQFVIATAIKKLPNYKVLKVQN